MTIMATSEKTVLLEQILAKHRDKTKKRYLEWDQLLTKLNKPGRDKFRLTKTSTGLELENALGDYLGDNLVFADKGKTLCLAEKMSDEEWARLLAEEKIDFLQKILLRHKIKEKKSYVQLKLTRVADLKEFGLAAKPAPTADQLEKALSPYLGSELALLKKKPTTAKGKVILYLAYKLPHEDFVKESLLTLKKAFSLKALADDVPLSNKEFVEIFNRMLNAGQLHITKIDDKFAITAVQLTSGSPVTAATTPLSPTPAPVSGHNDCELFQAAFEKMSRGRFYARICHLRRELGWSEERFNALLRKLRADGTVHLHAGDVSTMTEEDVIQCYTDENNFFYVNLTWKK